MSIPCLQQERSGFLWSSWRPNLGNPASCSKARASTSTCSASCASFKVIPISARTAPRETTLFWSQRQTTSFHLKGNHDTDRYCSYIYIYMTNYHIYAHTHVYIYNIGKMICGLINDISMAFDMAFATSRSLFACLEAPGTAGPCSSFLSPAGPGRGPQSFCSAHSWHIYGKSMGKNRGIPILFTNPFANDFAKLLSGSAFAIERSCASDFVKLTHQLPCHSSIPLVSVVPMDPPKDGSNGLLIWSRSFVIILPFSSTINRLTKIWRVFSNIFQHIITAMDCGSLTQKQAIVLWEKYHLKGPLSSLLGLRWP